MMQAPSLALSFRKIEERDRAILKKWLAEDHVCEFVDPNGCTFDNIDRYLTGKEQIFDHWIACMNNVPFCYFPTSIVKEVDDYAKYRSPKGKTITLDVILGNKDFLGKGFAAPTIKAFLKTNFPDVKRVLIDPEIGNPKAIHVYEKAGFIKVETYIPNWDSKKRLHQMMHLDINSAV